LLARIDHVLGALARRKTMPGKRPVRKGSFGSHFDELVNQFDGGQPKPKRRRREPEPTTQNGNVHDRLFESAWRNIGGT
jgi:hypothetical protein